MSALSDLIYDTASGISYRTAQPAPEKPQRLLVLLHGVHSNEESLRKLASGAPEDTLVVVARGPLLLDAQAFAWFHVEFGGDGPTIVAEEAEAARKKLIILLQSLHSHYGLSSANTTLAGFSQGGIMSASVALSSPASVGRFGLMSGRILPEVIPHVAKKADLVPLRGFVSHGEDDAVLSVDWAVRSNALLDELEVQHEYHLYPADHEITEAMQNDFYAWLSSGAQSR